MISAVLTGRVITPLEPLPGDWQDGQALAINPKSHTDFDLPAFDIYCRKLEEMFLDAHPDDDRRRQEAIDDHRHETK